MNNDVGHFFMYLWAIHLSLWSTCSSLLPVLKLDCLPLNVSLEFFMYSRYKSFVRYITVNVFSPSLVHIHIVNCLLMRSFNLIKYNLLIFFLLWLCFLCPVRKSLLILTSGIYFLFTSFFKKVRLFKSFSIYFYNLSLHKFLFIFETTSSWFHWCLILCCLLIFYFVDFCSLTFGFNLLLLF